MLGLVPEQIEAAARTLIRAERTNLGIEITLPVAYPDGELVSVVASFEQGECVVHDASAGAMSLAGAGVRINRHLNRRLVELVGRYGCQFVANRVIRRCAPDQVAFAAVAVANASRTVGDQALEVRRQAEQDFVVAVTERLREIVGPRLRTNEPVTGKSGRTYRVTGIVLDEAQKEPVAFVASVPNRSAVASQFAEFYDLRHAHSKVINESVYDEERDLRDEDRRLLGMVSKLVPFAQTRTNFSRLVSSRLVST